MHDLQAPYNDIFVVPEGKRRSRFLQYFPYHKEADFKKKIDGLYKEYYAQNGSYEYEAATYSQVTEDYVKSYTSNKDTLISVLKEYNDHLNKEYGMEISIVFPPIPVANTFERLMFEAKYLQDSEHSIADLPDILWQSSRTIEDDIKKLQGRDGDPLQVCGQKFVIGEEEVDRSMGHMYFESTAHPLFLTCNLTQVITTLEGLRTMSERPGFTGYAISMARNMWRQLSEYGKKRIFYVMENLLCEDTAWYEALENDEKHAYKTELECCMNRDDLMMRCMKDDDYRDRLCIIEYQSDDKSEFLTDVKVLNLTKNGWKVAINGKERVLDREKIVRCSFHKDNMF